MHLPLRNMQSRGKLVTLKTKAGVLRVFEKAVKSKLFPHFLAAFQWVLLFACITSNTIFLVAVAGGTANGSIKMLSLFNLWMLLWSILLCLMLFRMRRDGTIERVILALSLMTLLFSLANTVLHFVSGQLLLMKTTELIAWTIYNLMFSISAYKIFVWILPVLRGKSAKPEKGAFHYGNESLAKG